jgi:hypothetical protein
MDVTRIREFAMRLDAARDEADLDRLVEELRAVREAHPQSVFTGDLAEMVTMKREAIRAGVIQWARGR